jgi:hypothetical protein
VEASGGEAEGAGEGYVERGQWLLEVLTECGSLADVWTSLTSVLFDALVKCTTHASSPLSVLVEFMCAGCPSCADACAWWSDRGFGEYKQNERSGTAVNEGQNETEWKQQRRRRDKRKAKCVAFV